MLLNKDVTGGRGFSQTVFMESEMRETVSIKALRCEGMWRILHQLHVHFGC